VPKIITECCELVKLCHITGSGPVLLDTLYMVFYGNCESVLLSFRDDHGTNNGRTTDGQTATIVYLALKAGWQ